MSRTKLTAIKVANIKPDPSKRIEIPDAGKPGLFLVVQPNGRKSWAVRYRRLQDQKPRKLTLQGFPSLGVAHKLAQAALDRAAEGGDPAAEKQEQKRTVRPPEVALVDDAFRLFLERHTRSRSGRPIRESTRRETARILGFKRDPQHAERWVETGSGVLAKWKGRRVTSLRPADVQDLLDDQIKRGPITANRTLAALKSFFGWLMRRDPEALSRSPCEGIGAPSPEAPRERVLTDVELAALWRAASAESYPFGPLIKMLVLTGCRRDEVREASWGEFDLEAREWLLPAARTKNGRPHLVPIVDQMMAIIEELPRINGDDSLFASPGGPGPIASLSKCKVRLAKAVAEELGKEPDRWTLHDVRRSVVTGLQRLRFPQEVAEAVVNHRSGTLAGVASVYARHDFAVEKREALEAWARHVDSIVTDKPGKVVPMRRAGK